MKKYIGFLSLTIALGNVQFIQANISNVDFAKLTGSATVGSIFKECGCKHFGNSILKGSGGIVLADAFATAVQLRKIQNPHVAIPVIAGTDYALRFVLNSDQVKNMLNYVAENSVVKKASHNLPAIAPETKLAVQELSTWIAACLVGYAVDSKMPEAPVAG